MSRPRHTPEQIVRKLREADRLLSEGSELPEVLKRLEIAEVTYHRWRNQFGGMKAEDVKRLKGLEAEKRQAQADRRGSGPGYPGPEGVGVGTDESQVRAGGFFGFAAAARCQSAIVRS
ncbi:transposase [Conexibacter sp. DBS9H8]|uniref:transposase n=1 Tax=Conexibacter sp. DBS9H8 TaxID=2937801 RepID=UPI00353177F0